MKLTYFIENKGDTLFTTIYPNEHKETIILLHGGPGFPSDLEENVEFFKSYFQVITFHQRGTTQSSCKSNNYSMSAYVSDIEAIAKHFSIQKFHLFGHSWGGLYAQIYAQLYPEKLLSLFLCSSGSGTGVEWQQTEKEVMQFNQSKCTSTEWIKMGMNSLLGMLGSDDAYRRLFKQVIKNYNNGFLTTDNFGINFDNMQAGPINKTRKEILKYPILNVIAKSNFKITVVYGDQDIYKSSKEFVINRYPTALVWTIEACGHLPWLHNPVKYKQMLNEHYEIT